MLCDCIHKNSSKTPPKKSHYKQYSQASRSFKPDKRTSTIVSLRKDIVNIDKDLTILWERYNDPTQYAVVIHIVKLRAKLQDRLIKYQEVIQPTTIQQDSEFQAILTRLARTENRLKELDDVMEAEVCRFELQIRDLTREMESVRQGIPTYIETFKSTIKDVQIELSVYLKKWEDLLKEEHKQRLNTIKGMLDALNIEAKESILPGLEENFEPASIPKIEQSNKKLSSKKSSLKLFKSMRSKAFESGSYEEYQANLSRKQTLGMMATLVRQATLEEMNDNDEENNDDQLRPTVSFSSSLYRTAVKRQGSIMDVGEFLIKQPVRGDGRCLFRSVAKGQAFATGVIGVWNENTERAEADRLRTLAVEELKKQKDLLLSYCVIEGNFDLYIKRMVMVRTFGGEPELLMLAIILHRPIAVYISQHKRYRQIQVYGRQYVSEPLYILYSDGIHYDCLAPQHYLQNRPVQNNFISV